MPSAAVVIGALRLYLAYTKIPQKALTHLNMHCHKTELNQKTERNTPYKVCNAVAGTGKVPYFFGNKTEFFPSKTIPKI